MNENIYRKQIALVCACGWLHGTSFSTMLSWIFDNEVFAPMPKSKEDNLYQAW